MTENIQAPQPENQTVNQVPTFPQGSPAPSPAKGLAIAALVVGIIAFLTGLVPVVGIVLGAVGLVLGIIALVKKQPKGLALTGTILAAVALVVSLVATIVAGAFTSAVVETVNEQTSVTSETPGQDSTAEEDAEKASAEGTRENPLPLGSLISSKDWDVVLNSVNLEANADVAAANMFNEAPADGYQYAVANVSVTYKGEGSSYPAFVSIDYVTATGEVISTWDSLAVAPEPTFGGGELYAGGSATGNLAFAIPVSADGVLRVKAGMLADEMFVAIR
ncbi:MAG TPA: DUF4190 domain-containing protein [Microbacteriaceae bacterium]|nr:DUF4190 domain-containing protein [Microbacteriaceae bacterium]HQC92532.1 DUF4190 domain-containing protein [Microbacteriaceae bacterium]